MTDKQTICPNCKTTYKVSVPQLTVAQGMVSCPKCNTDFNALLNLSQNGQLITSVKSKQNAEPVPVNVQTSESVLEQNNTDDLDQQHNTTHTTASTTENTTLDLTTSARTEISGITEQSTPTHTKISAVPVPEQKVYHETSVLEIFDRKVENSNIDLRTYLNSLNQFNLDPLTNIPSLNLSAGQAHGHTYSQQQRFEARKPLYYFCWSLINIALLLVLVFQILWFNPALLDKHPALHSAFNTTCNLLNCDTIDDRYNQIRVENIKVQKIGKSSTQFSGSLLNTYKKSLEVPIIKLTLKAQGQTILTQTITAKDYLNESLSGINRIPSNSPYKFKFTIDKSRNAFDEYYLEIIHP